MSTRLTDREIEDIARRIAADISRADKNVYAPRGEQTFLSAAGEQTFLSAPGLGVFSTVDEAVRAAKEAQPRFVALKLEHRARIIAAIRKAMLENCEALAKAAWEETGLGRYEDKV